MAIAEENEAGKLTVLIRPDDILDLQTDESDFLKTIRDWKIGLLDIMASKILNSLGANNSDYKQRIAAHGGRIVEALKSLFEDKIDLNLTPARQKVIGYFLKNQTIYIYIDDLDRGWQGRSADNQRISATSECRSEILQPKTAVSSFA